MGVIGVLWLIVLVLKIVGVIAASWWLVILWPIPVVLLLWLIIMIFGVAIVGFSSLR
jgi:hypothetical protein